MNFEKQKVNNYFLYDTEIENLFIGEYMLDAPGDYVKIYLLAFMRSGFEGNSDNELIARDLSVSLETVHKAWDYWQECGLVKKIAKSDNPDSYCVEFINLKEAVFGKCAIEFSGSEKIKKDAMDLSSAELAKVFSEIENITGRLLEGSEAQTVAGWISDLRISPDVVLYCYKYSNDNCKSNRVKYVEKILKDWHEKNLDTVEKIESYLGESDKAFKLYKRVFKALGFTGRNPSEPEKEIMRKWFFDMNLSIDDVLEAVGKTTGTGNPNIKYVDSILRNNKNDTQSASQQDAYSGIHDLYQKIREENENRTLQLREKIFAEIPSLEKISSELKITSSEMISAMLSKNISKQNELKKKQQELYAQRETLLKEHGYAVNALDPIYNCSICKDTGVLEDGSMCSCAKKLRLSNGR